MEKILVKNRKAHFDYELLERFEAGIVLKGHEVKSLKSGGGNFTGSYVSLQDGEMWIKGFSIALYEKATIPDYEAKHPRKLLIRKAEIQKITGELNTQGVTLIPLSCGLKNGKIKIGFALARGKKKVDKRNTLKNRDMERRAKQAVRNY